MFIKNGHLLWCRTFAEPCLCKTSGYGIAAVLALAIAALEYWGSDESGSLALFADFWHVVSDLGVYATSMWASVLMARNPELALGINRRWGSRNASLLIAVAAVTIGLAIWRIIRPAEILTDVMLWVAAIGLAVNMLMYFVLKAFRIQHEHEEDHRHDHVHTTALVHTAIDTGISVVVVASALAMDRIPAAAAYSRIIDPIASIALCGVLIALALAIKKEIRATKDL